MSEVIGEVEILNLVTGSPDTARIMMGLDDTHLTSFRQLWVPQMQDAISEIRDRHTDNSGQIDRDAALAEISEKNLQDSHWEWDTKWRVMEQDLSKVFFAIECDEAAQALMIVDNSAYSCRHSDNAGSNLIYVEYVAVAPWNRRALVDTPQYARLGKTLIGTAISLSIEEEFDGWIGLHSLPQSTDFYRNGCGMTDFGPDDDKQGMNYFEMTELQAETFLTNG